MTNIKIEKGIFRIFQFIWMNRIVAEHKQICRMGRWLPFIIKLDKIGAATLPKCDNLMGVIC